MPRSVDYTPFSGADVKKFRTLFNLSIDELATVLGVTDQAVIFWEAGQRKVPETTVRVLQLFERRPELIHEF